MPCVEAFDPCPPSLREQIANQGSKGFMNECFDIDAGGVGRPSDIASRRPTVVNRYGDDRLVNVLAETPFRVCLEMSEDLGRDFERLSLLSEQVKRGPSSELPFDRRHKLISRLFGVLAEARARLGAHGYAAVRAHPHH